MFHKTTRITVQDLQNIQQRLLNQQQGLRKHWQVAVHWLSYRHSDMKQNMQTRQLAESLNDLVATRLH